MDTGENTFGEGGASGAGGAASGGGRGHAPIRQTQATGDDEFQSLLVQSRSGCVEFKGAAALQAMTTLGHPSTFKTPNDAKDYFAALALEMAFKVRVAKASGGGNVGNGVVGHDAQHSTTLVTDNPEFFVMGNTYKCTQLVCKQCVAVHTGTSKTPGAVHAQPYNGFSIQLATSDARISAFLSGPHTEGEALPCHVTGLQLHHLKHTFNLEEQVYTSQLQVQRRLDFFARMVRHRCFATVPR